MEIVSRAESCWIGRVTAVSVSIVLHTIEETMTNRLHQQTDSLIKGFDSPSKDSAQKVLEKSGTFLHIQTLCCTIVWSGLFAGYDSEKVLKDRSHFPWAWWLAIVLNPDSSFQIMPGICKDWNQGHSLRLSGPVAVGSCFPHGIILAHWVGWISFSGSVHLENWRTMAVLGTKWPKIPFTLFFWRIAYFVFATGKSMLGCLMTKV